MLDDRPPLLDVRGLEVVYGSVTGLRAADLSVHRGEIVAVLGSNGAGKSSLLKGITGLAVARGSVRLDGDELLGQPSEQRITRGVGLVPEGRQVFGALSVEENILVGAYSLPRRSRRQALEETLERFPILGQRRRQPAGTLSGGQQQVLAIARAVVTSPALCLMDEPSLGLAPVMVDQVFEEIVALRTGGMTLVVVEQLASVVLSVADRGYVLENGLVRLDGPAASLRDNPEVQRRYLGVSEAVPAQGSTAR